MRQATAVSGRHVALVRWAPTVLVLLALFPCIVWTIHVVGPDYFGDYKGNVWEPGKAVLSGDDPYPHRPFAPPPQAIPPVYPPLTFLALLPLSLLSAPAAGLLMCSLVLACFALAFLALRPAEPLVIALGVSMPVVFCAGAANPIAFAIFAIALGWRWRDRARTAGVLIGLAIAIKLFVVPLIAWLAFTRRYVAAAVAASSAVVLILGSWAVIGFRGITRFPELVSTDAINVGRRGMFLQGTLRHLGLDYHQALLVGIVAAVAVLVAARHLADAQVFAACLLASLFASPIVWSYYLWLLPLAVLAVSPSRRFILLSVAWVVLGYALAAPDIGGLKTAGVMSVATAALFAALIWREPDPIGAEIVAESWQARSASP